MTCIERISEGVDQRRSRIFIDELVALREAFKVKAGLKGKLPSSVPNVQAIRGYAGIQEA